MKNITPQARVKQLAEMMYPGTTVEVGGCRPSARSSGGKKPKYNAGVKIDGKYVVSAQERNWRTAYKTLEIMLTKLSFQ